MDPVIGVSVVALLICVAIFIRAFIGAHCPHCGKWLRVAQRYCPRCGTELG
ncbi:MAG TPA: LITAF-like zinc ribbon domain-containing protein [Candidatus Limnocylindria bacterium]|nr:LITAF-like zinc ribbon domain-containing protein [Candidatus Limnocylindria bacterium]